MAVEFGSSALRFAMLAKANRRNTMTQALRFVSIACAACAFGLTLAHVLEAPGKRALSGADWTLVQQRFYGGFAVVGGITEVLGLLASLALAVWLRSNRRALLFALLGALGFAGMLLSFALGNQPVNLDVANWSTTGIPADWTTYRDRWDAAHALSAAFAAMSFIALLIGALRREGRFENL